MDSNSDYDSDINDEFIQYGGTRDNSKFSDSVGRVFILDAKNDGDSDVVITLSGEKLYVDKENFVKFFNNTNTEETTLYTKMDNSYKHPMNKGANDSFMILPGIVKDMSSVKLAEMLKEGTLEEINSRSEFEVIAPGITYNPMAFDNDEYWRIFSQLKNYKFNISEDLLFIFDKNHTDSVEEITFNEITTNPLELINKDINELHENIAEKIHYKLKTKTLETDKKTLSSIIIVKGGRPLIKVETAAATAGTAATTPPLPTPEGTAATTPPPTSESPPAEPQSEPQAGTEAPAAPIAAAPIVDAPAEPTTRAEGAEVATPPAGTEPPAEATAAESPPVEPEGATGRALNNFVASIKSILSKDKIRILIDKLKNLLTVNNTTAGGSYYKLNKSKSKKIKRIKIYKKNTKKYKKKLKNTKKRNVRNTKKR